MKKMLPVIIGGGMVILGFIGIIVWWSAVVTLIKAGLALALFFIGIGLTVFGVGELRTPAEIPPEQSGKEEEAPSEQP